MEEKVENSRLFYKKYCRMMIERLETVEEMERMSSWLEWAGDGRCEDKGDTGLMYLELLLWALHTDRLDVFPFKHSPPVHHGDIDDSYKFAMEIVNLEPVEKGRSEWSGVRSVVTDDLKEYLGVEELAGQTGLGGAHCFLAVSDDDPISQWKIPRVLDSCRDEKYENQPQYWMKIFSRPAEYPIEKRGTEQGEEEIREDLEAKESHKEEEEEKEDETEQEDTGESICPHLDKIENILQNLCFGGNKLDIDLIERGTSHGRNGKSNDERTDANTVKFQFSDDRPRPRGADARNLACHYDSSDERSRSRRPVAKNVACHYDSSDERPRSGRWDGRNVAYHYDSSGERPRSGRVDGRNVASCHYNYRYERVRCEPGRRQLGRCDLDEKERFAGDRRVIDYKAMNPFELTPIFNYNNNSNVRNIDLIEKKKMLDSRNNSVTRSSEGREAHGSADRGIPSQDRPTNSNAYRRDKPQETEITSVEDEITLKEDDTRLREPEETLTARGTDDGSCSCYYPFIKCTVHEADSGADSRHRCKKFNGPGSSKNTYWQPSTVIENNAWKRNHKEKTEAARPSVIRSLRDHSHDREWHLDRYDEQNRPQKSVLTDLCDDLTDVRRKGQSFPGKQSRNPDNIKRNIKFCEHYREETSESTSRTIADSRLRSHDSMHRYPRGHSHLNDVTSSPDRAERKLQFNEIPLLPQRHAPSVARSPPLKSCLRKTQEGLRSSTNYHDHPSRLSSYNPYNYYMDDDADSESSHTDF